MGSGEAPFEPTWDSLSKYVIPKWYQDAKFGIFIHWGVYSVPAFGDEWYPRKMYLRGSNEFQHHVQTYGPQTQFGYKDFIPQLTAEKFDPGAWADLFQEAGAKFVVPVAEHHDGFPMYDTGLSEWSAAKMGPRLDVIGALSEAVRDRGLVFGLSSHRAEHWWFFHGGTEFPSDVQDPRYKGLYGPAMPDFFQPDHAFLEDWLARCKELVDGYRPQIFYFDWWIEQPAFQPYLQKFAAYYYNRGAQWRTGVAIDYKYEAFPSGAAVLDVERGQLADIRPLFWQSDTSVSRNSWGHIENQDYKDPNEIIQDLIDIVSKNGALLLNIGPLPDGTIPEPEKAILRQIGTWLRCNGAAIYGTTPWRVFGEGPTEVAGGAFKDHQPFTCEDIRFTVGAGSLYAIALAWPENGKLTIRSLSTLLRLYNGTVSQVSLLGYDGVIRWERDAVGLHVLDLPHSSITKVGCTLRIEGNAVLTHATHVTHHRPLQSSL